VLAAAVLLIVVTLASLSVFDAAAKTSGASKAPNSGSSILPRSLAPPPT